MVRGRSKIAWLQLPMSLLMLELVVMPGQGLCLWFLLGQEGPEEGLALGLLVLNGLLGLLGLLMLLEELPCLWPARPRPLKLLRQVRWEVNWVRPKASLTFKTKSEGEGWVKPLGWLIPRRYTHVVGDILEDCAEMREAGCSERRIKLHVGHQWLIAVVTLVPMAVKTSFIDILMKILSPPK